MDEKRGDTPRSRWLIERVLSGLDLSADGLVRRSGRPRTTGLSLPVSLDPLTYRPVNLLGLAKEVRIKGEMDPVIARGDLDDGLIGLRWPFNRTFGTYNPYTAVKRAGATWDSDLRVWPVSTDVADRVTRKCVENGARVVPLQLGWSGVIARRRPLVNLTDDIAQAWAIEIDIQASMSSPDRGPLIDCLRGAADWLPEARWFIVGDDDLGLVTSDGLTDCEMQAGLKALRARGVRVRAKPTGISDRSVTATADPAGVMVSVEADPADRRMLILAKPITWGIGARWTGSASISAERWPDLADRLSDLGVTVDDRVDERQVNVAHPVSWDEVPGWSRPAAGGNTLRVYQRSGVEFVLRQGMRALIGDEMGTGKTVQAITAAHAAGYRRIVAVLPKNAVGVWRRQLNDWCWPGQEPDVIVISDTTEMPALPGGKARPAWVLITYDTLTPRTEKFTLSGLNDDQQSILSDELIDFGIRHEDSSAGSLTIKLDPSKPELLDRLAASMPSGIHGSDRDRLRRALTRARGQIRDALLDWHPDLVVVDEAHRIKNDLAKRTAAVRTLIRNQTRGALLLTGTPLRNRAEEGLTLLEALLPIAQYREMAKRDGMDRVDLARSLFDSVMIRRTKQEVLPELPEKIRQEIDIRIDRESEEEYQAAMETAQEAYSRALIAGGTRGDAAREALPHWSQARRLLGLAKIADGGIADLVREVVDERGACLLFAHHRDVIDTLRKQIEAAGISVVVVDGRTATDDLTEAERAFQAGEVEVFLGGITAASEALTLTRADTCVFAELAWVPAEMLQAEDRGHRIGQAAKAYQIVTFLADLGSSCRDQEASDGFNMDALMWHALKRKSSEINTVLDKRADGDDEAQDETQTIQAMLGAVAYQRFKAASNA